jgi:hypothetical protein
METYSNYKNGKAASMYLEDYYSSWLPHLFPLWSNFDRGMVYDAKQLMDYSLTILWR